jgi:hypothetical protein
MSRLPCAWVWWFGGGWHQSVDMIWEGRGLENMRGTVVSCRTQANNSSAEPLLPSDQIPQLVKCNHVVLHDEASRSIVDHNRDAAPPTPKTVLPSRVPRHIVRLDLQRQLLLFRSSWDLRYELDPPRKSSSSCRANVEAVSNGAFCSPTLV